MASICPLAHQNTYYLHLEAPRRCADAQLCVKTLRSAVYWFDAQSRSRGLIMPTAGCLNGSQSPTIVHMWCISSSTRWIFLVGHAGLYSCWVFWWREPHSPCLTNRTPPTRSLTPGRTQTPSPKTSTGPMRGCNSAPWAPQKGRRRPLNVPVLWPPPNSPRPPPAQTSPTSRRRSNATKSSQCLFRGSKPPSSSDYGYSAPAWPKSVSHCFRKICVCIENGRCQNIKGH